MGINEIIKKVNSKLKIKNYSLVKKITDQVFIEIEENLLKGQNVIIDNFGSFDKKIVKEKTINNRFTNGAYTIPQRYRITFKLSNNFKAKLKEQKVYKGN